MKSTLITTDWGVKCAHYSRSKHHPHPEINHFCNITNCCSFILFNASFHIRAVWRLLLHDMSTELINIFCIVCRLHQPRVTHFQWNPRPISVAMAPESCLCHSNKNIHQPFKTRWTARTHYILYTTGLCAALLISVSQISQSCSFICKDKILGFHFENNYVFIL